MHEISAMRREDMRRIRNERVSHEMHETWQDRVCIMTINILNVTFTKSLSIRKHHQFVCICSVYSHNLEIMDDSSLHMIYQMVIVAKLTYTHMCLQHMLGFTNAANHR